MILILDACAVIAFLRGEPGGELVESYLINETYTCFIHVINLCEVYYDVIRNDSQQKADEMLSDLRGSGTIFRRVLAVNNSPNVRGIKRRNILIKVPHWS